MYYGHVMHLPLVIYELHQKGHGFVVDFSYGYKEGGGKVQQITLSEMYTQFNQRRNNPSSSGHIIVLPDCKTTAERVYGGRKNPKLFKFYEIIDYRWV